jgi:hypothetical protein
MQSEAEQMENKLSSVFFAMTGLDNARPNIGHDHGAQETSGDSINSAHRSKYGPNVCTKTKFSLCN